MANEKSRIADTPERLEYRRSTSRRDGVYRLIPYRAIHLKVSTRSGVSSDTVSASRGEVSGIPRISSDTVSPSREEVSGRLWVSFDTVSPVFGRDPILLPKYPRAGDTLVADTLTVLAFLCVTLYYFLFILIIINIISMVETRSDNKG